MPRAVAGGPRGAERPSRAWALPTSLQSYPVPFSSCSLLSSCTGLLDSFFKIFLKIN